jgi:hypothetical protein
MILLMLLLGGLAQAADSGRECNIQDGGLKRFFAEYTRAYSRAKGLRKSFTPVFWEEFAEFAPKRAGKAFSAKLLGAEVRGDYCFVTWTSAAKEPPARFRLVNRGGTWLIDGIQPEEN